MCGVCVCGGGGVYVYCLHLYYVYLNFFVVGFASVLFTSCVSTFSLYIFS